MLWAPPAGHNMLWCAVQSKCSPASCGSENGKRSGNKALPPGPTNVEMCRLCPMEEEKDLMMAVGISDAFPFIYKILLSWFLTHRGNRWIRTFQIKPPSDTLLYANTHPTVQEYFELELPTLRLLFLKLICHSSPVIHLHPAMPLHSSSLKYLSDLFCS